MRKHETLIPPLTLASSLPHRRPLSARFRLFAPAARPRRSFATYFFKYSLRPSRVALPSRPSSPLLARSLMSHRCLIYAPSMFR